MKKFIGIILVLMIAVSAYASIEKLAVETQATNLLSSIKARLDSDSVKYVKIRQQIEDKISNYTAQLETADKTKLGALPKEIQDIINAIDDLRTKIETNYPTVE